MTTHSVTASQARNIYFDTPVFLMLSDAFGWIAQDLDNDGKFQLMGNAINAQVDQDTKILHNNLNE